MKPCPKGHKDCPHPENDSFAEIEFTPEKKMVDWLGPLQLADTGLKAVVAATFGSYADKREVEVAVSPFDGVEYLDLSNKKDEVWFDYIADLGDGFNPSYAMAYLLAKETLAVDEHNLPHGEVVILGGDQIYPTSNRDDYQNKFIGPYRSAMPWRPDNETRFIHAIPGNHDWYDGLTSFLRIFCQARDKTGRGARWIGGWKASQRRSYFAIRLPGNWWVWGIDGQLESDMDKPQLNYFSDLGDEIVKMGGEHKVVLVTPEPNWVYCGGVGSEKLCALVEPERFNTLAHFEKRYVRAKGLRLAMVIAGDLHHYVRYESDDHLAHRITCGGGGAYLLGTHQMPKSIVVREGTDEVSAVQEPKRTYTRTDDTMYPRPKDSKRIARGIWLLGIRNRWFAFFLGTIYLLFAWIVESASRTNRAFFSVSLLDEFQKPGRDVWTIFGNAVTAVRFSPASVIFVVAVIVGLGLFTSSQKLVKPLILSWIGYVHGLLHVLLAVALMWLCAHTVTNAEPTEWLFLFEFTALMLALGWTAGATLFAVYIHLTSKFTGGHTNEIYSSQALEGYKNFMRFCVRGGELHVYPIGVKDVPTKWEFKPDRDCRDPFFEPASGTKITPTIIDGPFVVK